MLERDDALEERVVVVGGAAQSPLVAAAADRRAVAGRARRAVVGLVAEVQDRPHERPRVGRVLPEHRARVEVLLQHVRGDVRRDVVRARGDDELRVRVFEVAAGHEAVERGAVRHEDGVAVRREDPGAGTAGGVAALGVGAAGEHGVLDGAVLVGDVRERARVAGAAVAARRRVRVVEQAVAVVGGVGLLAGEGVGRHVEELVARGDVHEADVAVLLHAVEGRRRQAQGLRAHGDGGDAEAREAQGQAQLHEPRRRVLLRHGRERAVGRHGGVFVPRPCVSFETSRSI